MVADETAGDELSVRRGATVLLSAAFLALSGLGIASWVLQRSLVGLGPEQAAALALGLSGAVGAVAIIVGLTGGRTRPPAPVAAPGYSSDDERGAASDALLASPGAAVLHDLETLLSEVDGAYVSQRRLLRGIGHDLRSPLASIAFTSEQLADGQMGPLSEEQAEACRLAAQTASRLMRQVQALYAYAEAGGKADPAYLAEMDIVRAVSRAVSMFEPTAAARGLAMTLHAGSDPICVCADPRIIERSLANVIDNAIKFTDEGEIRITVGTEDTWAVVEVRDSGVGISAADMPHITETYYRGSAGADRNGTGIGLAVAKEFVEGMGGSLGVKSEEGVGTIVRICIPVVSAGDSQQAGESER